MKINTVNDVNLAKNSKCKTENCCRVMVGGMGEVEIKLVLHVGGRKEEVRTTRNMLPSFLGDMILSA